MSDKGGISSSGESGGGPRVQTSKPPSGGPLASSIQGLNETVEPVILHGGKAKGGSPSRDSK